MAIIQPVTLLGYRQSAERCRDIKLPSLTATPRRALTVDDIVALAESIDPRHPSVVWLGAVLGLRRAEVAGLTVASLDLLRNTVTVG